MSRHILLFTFLIFIILGFSNKPGLSSYKQEAKSNLDSIYPPLKNFKAQNSSKSNDFASLTAGTDNNRPLADSLNNILYFYAQVKITNKDTALKLPLNISIVIDKSGSMEGIKMGNAKKAAKAIIDLLDPNDIVSIVAFDNYVDTIIGPMHPIDKEKIKHKIGTIVPQGGTNLWGGLEKGYEYVQKNNTPAYINRVLLLSDGGANVGVIDPEAIKENVLNYLNSTGISVSTFGIGLDFNEKLLTEMAIIGKGNFYYIDQPQVITNALLHEVNTISKPIGHNAELKIDIPKAFSLVQPLPLGFTLKDHTLSYKWQNIFPNEQKSILIKLKPAARLESSMNITTTFNYSKNTDNQNSSITVINPITITHQLQEHNNAYNKEMIEKTILFTSSEKIDKALDKTDENKLSEAINILYTNKEYLSKQTFYVSGKPQLLQIDSLNSIYLSELGNINKATPDSLKKLQKKIRNLNYQVKISN